MKLQKLYDDVHRDVKVIAAQTGKSSLRVGSQLMRFALREYEAGGLEFPESDDEAAVITKRKPTRK